ncbi:MAG: DUF4430 domain-containing protein [Candidatus Helarchaeota archaeon]
MKNKTKKILTVVAIVGAITGIGFWVCYTIFIEPDSLIKNVKVIVTTDYGTKVIVNETVTVPGFYNSKDVLNLVAEAKYAYGGGFITSINGIASQYPMAYVDWFFFANGFMTDVGILDYHLVDGDEILFDYHNWDYDNLFWSTIFQDLSITIKQGYGGSAAKTLIIYENSTYMNVALNLKMFLMDKNIQNISIKEANFVSESDKGSNSLLLIGGYSMSLMSDYYSKASTCGFFATFKNSTAIDVISNDTFTVQQTYGTSDIVGLVNIGQNPYSPNIIGDPNGKFVVAFSGLDKGSIINTVEKYIANDPAFSLSYGILFLNNVSNKLPFP